MAYATTADLATYLGVTVGSLPSNANILLERATDIIDYATMGRLDVTDTTQANVAKKATCQQAEYYITIGTDYDISGRDYEQLSIGSWSANFRDDSSTPTIAPRARRTLFLAGYLYRGVRMI